MLVIELILNESPIDLLTKKYGNVLTLEETVKVFLVSTNFFTYHRIYSAVIEYFKKIKYTAQSSNKPFILLQTKVLTKSNGGSKDFF